MRIDAHQHFWRYEPDAYAWIDDGMAELRRDFLPGDLRPELDGSGIDACVAVQARQDEEETRWLLSLAEQHPWIAGVVGWCDLCAPGLPEALDALAAHPQLVGLRHIVQAEPDDAFLLREDFCRGIAELSPRGLAYDLLIFPHQAPAAIQFAKAFPELRIVLDHLGKPQIKGGSLGEWGAQLRELSRLENVSVKLSGLVTEADWQRWTPAQLTPCLDTALEAFGPERLLFGSDWPVCLLGTDYARWHSLMDSWAAPLADSERAALFGGNAARVYRLETPAP